MPRSRNVSPVRSRQGLYRAADPVVAAADGTVAQPKIQGPNDFWPAGSRASAGRRPTRSPLAGPPELPVCRAIFSLVDFDFLACAAST
jgi:hypothetical protein